MNISYEIKTLIFAYCIKRSIVNIIANPETTVKSQIIKLISKGSDLSGQLGSDKYSYCAGHFEPINLGHPSGITFIQKNQICM